MATTKSNNTTNVNEVDHSSTSNNDHTELQWEPVTWYKHSGLRLLYLMMPIVFLTSTTRGYDASLLNGMQTMPAWREYFGSPKGSTLGLISATSQFGSLAAILVSPTIADRFGRKFGAAIGNVLIIVGAIIQVAPGTNRGMYMGGRVLLGFGSNISEAAAPLLLVELAHPQHRGALATMFNVTFFIGAILAAWTVYGCLDLSGNTSWRVPTALQAMMPSLQLVLIWFVPQSPRWLIARDRSEEAYDILAKYHASGDRNDQFAKQEFAEIRETLRLEAVASQSGWLEFFKTKGNRYRLLLVFLVAFFSQCSGSGLMSYYLHPILLSIGITDSTEQALINGGIQIWSFLVAMSTSLLVDKTGRRKLFLFAASGMLVVFTIWTACSAVYKERADSAAGKAVIGLIFCYYLVAGFAWPGLIACYTTEILPYQLRAKGMALCWTFISIASLVSQWVNPIGLEKIAWKFYFVYIVILVSEVIIIYFLFPETKGYPLEEVAQIFDGKDAAVNHIPVNRKTEDDREIVEKKD